MQGFDGDKEKLILVGIVSCLILYLEFGVFFRMQHQAIRDAGPKIAKLKKDIDTFNRESAMLQSSKQKNAPGAVKVKNIVSEQSLPNLWQSISDIADRNSVKILQMRPVKGKEEVVASAKCVNYTVVLDLSCGYHNLGAFLGELENADQFIAVQDIKIKGVSNDYFHQDVNVVLKTYARK